MSFFEQGCVCVMIYCWNSLCPITLSCSNLDGFMCGPLASPSMTVRTLLTPGVVQVLNAKKGDFGRIMGRGGAAKFLRCTYPSGEASLQCLTRV